MSNFTTVMVRSERAEQLKAFAAAEGVSFAAAVEHMISQAAQAGIIPDTLPGYDVNVADGHVWFAFQQFGFPAWPLGVAADIADLFDYVANHGKPERGNKLTFGEDEQFVLIVARRGNGIVLAAKDEETERDAKASMTPQMARDLARIIRKAAAQAAKK
jgi:hypothetical protein